MADQEFNSGREEFHSSPPERYRRDEFSFEREEKPRAEKDPKTERRHREAIRNRALVQVVSAAAAVVVVGNSLGVDYLGDFFGLTPITEVFETADGIAIPDDYAQYLDYLMGLCSSGADDITISRELNGETAYNAARYLDDMGYADMYFCGGTMHDGESSALNSEPALHLGVSNGFIMKLSYVSRASDILKESADARCVMTGGYGTAGSVTLAYNGTAKAYAKALRLRPIKGSYTEYEGREPDVTMNGEYTVLADDPEYAASQGWSSVSPCYLENGTLTFRRLDYIPPLTVTDGWLTLSEGVELEYNGGSASITVEGYIYSSAWRGSEDESRYHTALQALYLFSAYSEADEVETGIVIPDEYRAVFDRVMELCESGADDDEIVAVMESPGYSEAVSWWRSIAPDRFYDGVELSADPGDYPVLSLDEERATYYSSGAYRKLGTYVIDVWSRLYHWEPVSFRGTMSAEARIPEYGIYRDVDKTLEGYFVPDINVMAYAGLGEVIKVYYLYNGEIDFHMDEVIFDGEVVNGYFKTDDCSFETESGIYEYTDATLWAVFPGGETDTRLRHGFPAWDLDLSKALVNTWFAMTYYVVDESVDFSTSEPTPPAKVEIEISDDLKSILGALIEASKELMADDTAYENFQPTLQAACEAVIAENLQSYFENAWYVDGRLEETPSSGEALKLSTNIYKRAMTFASDASALFTGTEGFLVYDNDSSSYYFNGVIKVDSYYDEYGSLISGNYIERFSWSGENKENTRMSGEYAYDEDGAYLHNGTLTTENLGGATVSVEDGSLVMGGKLSASLGKTSWSGDEILFSVEYEKDEHNSYSNSTAQLRGDTIEENLYHSFMQKVSGFYMSYSSKYDSY